MGVLLSSFLPYIIGVLFAAGAGVGIFLGVKHSGVREQQAADDKKTLRDVRNANDVAAKIAGESDSAVADDLRSKWTKP